jgi:hypothetical protein
MAGVRGGAKARRERQNHRVIWLAQMAEARKVYIPFLFAHNGPMGRCVTPFFGCFGTGLHRRTRIVWSILGFRQRGKRYVF